MLPVVEKAKSSEVDNVMFTHQYIFSSPIDFIHLTNIVGPFLVRATCTSDVYPFILTKHPLVQPCSWIETYKNALPLWGSR